ncbi:MAG: hypothetical protein LBI67_00095, partial [Treponema sp.]|nr:hypothetical protein [Treponema sp.]
RERERARERERERESKNRAKRAGTKEPADSGLVLKKLVSIEVRIRLVLKISQVEFTGQV